MLSQAVRVMPRATNAAGICARRGFFRPPWAYGSSNPLVVMDRAMRDIERTFDRQWRDMDRHFGWPELRSAWRPFVDVHPTEAEFYRIKNPIVEEDGVKKFKLEFDVRRFKPEDVKIKTNAKDRVLKIEAKAENSEEGYKSEYTRKVSIPEGVTPSEITAKYRSDGVLEFEAPYVEPKKVDSPKETVLEIKHE